mmetsp:Transcript_25651/g.81453  ORF Transcript_25651/g.81453 Transcript_25651/m.81453 type:complete len:330 (-) Transcript_25651:2347-3336(-)
MNCAACAWSRRLLDSGLAFRKGNSSRVSGDVLKILRNICTPASSAYGTIFPHVRLIMSMPSAVSSPALVTYSLSIHSSPVTISRWITSKSAAHACFVSAFHSPPIACSITHSSACPTTGKYSALAPYLACRLPSDCRLLDNVSMSSPSSPTDVARTLVSCIACARMLALCSSTASSWNGNSAMIWGAISDNRMKICVPAHPAPLDSTTTQLALIVAMPVAVRLPSRSTVGLGTDAMPSPTPLVTVPYSDAHAALISGVHSDPSPCSRVHSSASPTTGNLEMSTLYLTCRCPRLCSISIRAGDLTPSIFTAWPRNFTTESECALSTVLSS